MTIRNARDTVLHFMADNLSGRTVHALRTDTNAPDAAVFQMNAVNIHFLNVDPGVQISTLHAVIDVVYDDENTAVDVLQQVWTLLNAAFYCHLYDYTDPSAPALIGGNLLWERGGVKFRNVRSDFYSHHSCALKLRY